MKKSLIGALSVAAAIAGNAWADSKHEDKPKASASADKAGHSGKHEKAKKAKKAKGKSKHDEHKDEQGKKH